MKVYVLIKEDRFCDDKSEIIGVFPSHIAAVKSARGFSKPSPWFSIEEYETETGEMTAKAYCVDYSL